MAHTIGEVEFKVQVVGTGVLADTMPIDLGILTVDLRTDGTEVVFDTEFVDKLKGALDAFRATMTGGA